MFEIDGDDMRIESWLNSIGEKNGLCTMSPAGLIGRRYKASWKLTDRILREIRCQSSEIEIGITDWTLSQT